MQNPTCIDYGTVHDAHYRADFGCVEARVRLHLSGEAPSHPGIEILTSVLAIQDEPTSSLNTRLVVSAARLFRQFEIKQAAQNAPTYGAFAA